MTDRFAPSNEGGGLRASRVSRASSAMPVAGRAGHRPSRLLTEVESSRADSIVDGASSVSELGPDAF